MKSFDTPQHRKFWALLISQAGDYYSTRMCEDMPREAAELLSEAEKQEMATAYEAWNSDGRDEAWFFPNTGHWLNFLAHLIDRHDTF